MSRTYTAFSTSRDTRASSFSKACQGDKNMKTNFRDVTNLMPQTNGQKNGTLAHQDPI